MAQFANRLTPAAVRNEVRVSLLYLHSGRGFWPNPPGGSRDREWLC